MPTRGHDHYPSWIFFLLLSVALIGQETAIAAEDSQILSRDIQAADKVKREEADQKLFALRRALVDDLINTFNISHNKTFHSAKHLAIRHMGVWRFEEVIPLLVRHIDWSFDEETIPKGTKYPPWIVYPAAIALRDIGGKTVRMAMVSAIQSSPNETKLKLYSWVLWNVDGVEEAKQRLSEVAKRSTEEDVRDRLRKAMEYVEKGDSVFVLE